MTAPPIPAAVRVGPHRFEIHHDTETRRQLDSNQKLGETHADTCRINIDADRPHTNVAETLLHEVLHATWSVVGLHGVSKLDPDDEELIVGALAPTLLAVLRDSPDLVAYLTAEADR